MINLLENKLTAMMDSGFINYYSITIHCHSPGNQSYRVSTNLDDDTWIIYDDQTVDFGSVTEDGATWIHRPFSDLLRAEQ